MEEFETKEISKVTLEWVKMLLRDYAGTYTELVDLIGDNQKPSDYKNYLKTLEVIKIVLEELN